MKRKFRGSDALNLLSRRCTGCFQSGHFWDQEFSGCPSECHFCGTPYSDPDGHLIFECSSRPTGLQEVLEAVDTPYEE